ncbi:MAG: UPF0755 protein [Gammaproteobacteria bacterium]|jgi:UPF0755 protein
MKRIFLWGSISVLGIMLVVASAAFWVWRDAQSVLDTPINLVEGPEQFEINRGASLATIARNLRDRGWLANEHYLRLEARRLKIGGGLQAGLYEVTEGSTPRQLLRLFVSGEVKVFQITFIEGTTFREIRKVLASNDNLKSTITDKDAVWIAGQISADLTNIEGQIFPATYYFSHGERDIDILRRAHTRMRELLESEWQGRAAELPYASPYDALIMASIIEKETGAESERAQISGVFARRLKFGMKLQTDPTVIYGLGTAFDGNLRRVDLVADTPYNTYTRHGLPPAPIAMPGAASIEAALHPATGSYLYFVGKGDGSHQFSINLKDHNAAVRRYQLKPRRSER